MVSTVKEWADRYPESADSEKAAWGDSGALDYVPGRIDVFAVFVNLV
jgi:hypothetical protein